MTGHRTSVYLSDEVVAAARRLKINVSEVCERALKAEIEGRLEALEHAVEAGRQAALQLERIRGWVTEEVEPPSESVSVADLVVVNGEMKDR